MRAIRHQRHLGRRLLLGLDDQHLGCAVTHSSAALRPCPWEQPCHTNCVSSCGGPPLVRVDRQNSPYLGPSCRTASLHRARPRPPNQRLRLGRGWQSLRELRLPACTSLGNARRKFWSRSQQSCDRPAYYETSSGLRSDLCPADPSFAWTRCLHFCCQGGGARGCRGKLGLAKRCSATSLASACSRPRR